MPPLAEAMYWHPQSTPNPANRWLREQIHRISRALGVAGPLGLPDMGA
jgi:hypothetical protein